MRFFRYIRTFEFMMGKILMDVLMNDKIKGDKE